MFLEGAGALRIVSCFVIITLVLLIVFGILNKGKLASLFAVLFFSCIGVNLIMQINLDMQVENAFESNGYTVISDANILTKYNRGMSDVILEAEDGSVHKYYFKTVRGLITFYEFDNDVYKPIDLIKE